MRPTGEVRLLRDAYGGRFGVLITCRYPDPDTVTPAGGADEHVFLIDVDTCSSIVEVVDASVHDGPADAADAWRGSVGAPAAAAEPAPVDAALLADLLPTPGTGDLGVMGGETRGRMDNYYRVLRRSDDLAQVLATAGRPLPTESRWLVQARDGLPVDSYVEEFLDWYPTDAAPADPDAVAALAETWLEGTLPETRLSCSPHRVRNLQALIAIEWHDEPLVEQVAVLLPHWTRWCAYRTGLDQQLTARSLAAAQRDPREWTRIQDEEPAGAPVPE